MEFLKTSNRQNNEKENLTELEKTKSERVMIKQQLSGIYNSLGFGETEKKLLFKIIDNAQDKIEKLKEMLIGTNIDNDPAEITEKTLIEINQITEQMMIDLKAKTNELRARKK